MTRILIVDDHELVREGLKTVLKNQSQMQIVGEAESYEELMKKMKRLAPDIIILDISLKDRSGLDVLKNIRETHPDVGVLILSMHPEERFAIRALKAGAAGYVNKQMAATELVKAIDRVRAGDKYISPELAKQLASEVIRSSLPLPHTFLTDREYEILRLIAVGKTASKIAKDLSLSVNTITTYRARILEKMKMRTNAEIIRYALEHHLID